MKKDNSIVKFKYMFSIFDFMGTQPQPKQCWEIGQDGVVEYYVVDPESKELTEAKRWTVSKEKIMEFFKTIQDIIDKSDGFYEVEDDTVREVEITYQNNKSKVIPAYTVDNTKGFEITIEKEFWYFIEFVENPERDFYIS